MVAQAVGILTRINVNSNVNKVFFRVFHFRERFATKRSDKVNNYSKKLD